MSENGEDDFEQKLEEALSLYDLVLNINTLSGIKEGWKIYGSKENRYRKITGRTVALVGPFKVGKTWLTKKLLGVELRDSPTVPTLGLSMKLPASNVENKPAEAKVTTSEKHKKKSSIITGPTKKKSANKSASSISDMIVFDTAGTDRPCDDDQLKEAQAVEFFLRELIIQVAERVICVIPRFDRIHQTYISNLIQQINDQHPSNPINEKRKLVVVHNYSTIKSQDQFLDRINEVSNAYYNDDDETCWMAVGFKSNAIKTYQTKFTEHVFLLADNAEVEWKPCAHFSTTSPSAYNILALEKLKSIIESDQPKPIDLITKVNDILSRNLKRYLNMFNGFKLELKKAAKEATNKEEDDEEEDKTTDALVPVIDKQEVRTFVESTLEDSHLSELDTKVKEVVTTMQDFLADGNPWELADMQFTNKGIISESMITLEGNVQLFPNSDPKKPGVFKIAIKAAGFNDEHRRPKFIRVLLADNKKITVKFTTPQYGKEKYILYNSIKFGDSIWEYTLPETLRFSQPSTSNEIYKQRMAIENGMITISLDQAVDLSAEIEAQAKQELEEDADSETDD